MSLPTNPYFPDFSQFLEWNRARLEPAERELNEAWWEANVTATPATEARAAAAQKAFARLHADPAVFHYLRDVNPESLSNDERRQHALLLNTSLVHQIDHAVMEEIVDTERRVETQYNTFRPLFCGEPAGENRLRDVLRRSQDNEERRAAWEASKEIGRQVFTDVLHLVALRNREARRLGFADFYEMSLRLQEQEPVSLFRLLEEIEAKTRPLYLAYKTRLDESLKERFGVSVLAPWHYSDPFFQEAPPADVDFDRFYEGKDLEVLTTAFFDAIGLDIRDILVRSDLYERSDKCQHAFCIHVGRFEDVRVLANCTGSERWMSTMLHEFGHAVYDRYLGEDLPFFLREVAHTLTTEAIAELMGRQSRNAAFLTRFVGVPAAEARSVSDAGRAELQAQLLIFVRWVLVMVCFERAMYQDPGRDLDQLWWQLVERFQGISAPPGRRAPDWAAKLHLALSPVYYHNYLLGEMMASQILAFVRNNVLPDPSDETFLTSSQVGEYLCHEIFAAGARYRWDDLITRATGEPLTAARFIDDLTP